MRPGWFMVVVAAAACSGGESFAPGPATLGGTTVATPSDTDPTPSGADSSGTASTGATPATSNGSSSDASTGPMAPPDYAEGTWEIENVSSTNTMSLHGRRAVLDDGQEVVGWAEVSPTSLSVLNIVAAAQDGGAWSASGLTNFDGVQNTFPTMAAGGDAAYLAWTGRPSDTEDLDIYFATWQAASWSSPRNLTDAFAADDGDSKPVMIRRPGSLTVAFTSMAPGEFDTDVWVTEFLPEEDPTARELLIPASEGACQDLTGAATDDGVAHFIGRCGGNLIHATDRSGDWDYDTLAGVGTGLLSPAASEAADGNVHLVWIQREKCGTEDCDEVFYARTSDGVFGPATNASNSPNLSDRFPAVGVDGWGRVLVVSQVRLDGAAHLRLSVSEDGDTFGESIRISPEGTPDGYESPTDMAFSAEGLPSFVFLYNFDDSDPLNLDVHIARFVPR